MTLVVDASVAIKWVVQESGSFEADALIKEQPLIAPDFLLLECANVLAQHERRGALQRDDADARLGRIGTLGVRLYPTRDFVREAHRLAVTLRQSAYDCLYLALAREQGVRLVTADIRFAEAAEKLFPSAIRRF